MTQPDHAAARPSAIGFVSIGRNEGERLKAGVKAIQLLCPGAPVVYVDSGSSDGSVEFVESLGMETVALDMSRPFTAARARNAGFARLLELNPHLEYVQFLDGDCELAPGWAKTAMSALADSPRIGIVSGRRREKFPDATLYNQLMDIEWNTPIGETLAVLGDLCIKVSVFRQVEGFNDRIIAAEDDDLCIRVRAAGYKVFRLDATMSFHDANITSIKQWYRRSQRGGHGYAQIYHMHGQGPDRYFRKQLISVLAWGGAWSLLFLVFLLAYWPAALALLGIAALFVGKTALWRLRSGDRPSIALRYALLIYTGKIPELWGALTYWKNRLLAREHRLIEYK